MMRSAWYSGIVLTILTGCEQTPPAQPVEKPAPAAATERVPPAEDQPVADKTNTFPPAEQTPEVTRAVKPAAANAKLRTQAEGEVDPFSDAPVAGTPPEAFVFAQPPSIVPPVLLTTAEAQTCPVVVGDQFPHLSLPKLNGGEAQSPFQPPLSKPTVIFFWTPDNPYAQEALFDVNDLLGARADDLGVQVLGVCVADSTEAAKALLAGEPVEFENYWDAKGAEYAKVAGSPPPRIYLLDDAGKILWFDLEFSRGTRRELIQAIKFLVSQRKAG